MGAIASLFYCHSSLNAETVICIKNGTTLSTESEIMLQELELSIRNFGANKAPPIGCRHVVHIHRVAVNRRMCMQYQCSQAFIP